MATLAPLRVAPSGRYFETFEGEPFLFIGFNDAVDWPGLNGLFRRRDIASVDRYLEETARSGVNVIRIMLEYAHHEGRYFEKPVGRFAPNMVRFWDDLFARCEAYGLRVLLAPWDNFWMARRWHRHPYNAANGGPAAAPASFFADAAVIAATIERLKFVVQRWGGSGVLSAWDLFNEIHPYWGGTPQEQAATIRMLSDAVREVEEKTWGFTRPQTLSIFGPEPPQEYEDLIFHHPSLDFVTTHIYEGAIDFPQDTVQPALTMARWVWHARNCLEQRGTRRPFLDTEHGPIHLFNDHRRYLPEPFDDEYERHLMWAHLASGAAGSGMRWPARHPHVITEGMKRALGSLAAFTRYLDWRHFSPRPLESEIHAPETVHVFGCQDDDQALIWLLRGVSPGHQGPLPARDPLPGVRLTVRGLAPGQYCVRPWDTAKGESLPCCDVVTDSEGALLLSLPPLKSDIALAIRNASP